MEFKPTLLKTIVSSILGIIAGIFSSRVYYFGGSGSEYVFSIFTIIGFVVLLALTYSIYSLFQKKSKSDNKQIYFLVFGVIVSFIFLYPIIFLMNPQKPSIFDGSYVRDDMYGLGLEDDMYGLGLDFNYIKQNVEPEAAIPVNCNDFFECRMYRAFLDKDESLCNSETAGFNKNYCLALAKNDATPCLELPSGGIGQGKMEKTGADYQYQIDSANIKCINKLAFQYRDYKICESMNKIENSAFRFTPNGIGGITAKSGMIAQCMYTAIRNENSKVGNCIHIPLVNLSEVQNPSVIEGYVSYYTNKSDVVYLYRDKCFRDAVRIQENPLPEYCSEIHSETDKSICMAAIAIKSSKTSQEAK